jgi:predicted AlkP superfamily phosphohydrolase/phosphomutase
MLYLNIQGRDPEGLVSMTERAGLAAAIGSKLMQITTPGSTQPLFDRIYFSEEVYDGPLAAYAPDLILDGYASGWNIQTRPYTPVNETVHERYFVGDQGNHGWHSREGIYIFCGPAFAAGQTAIDGHVTDIPGTLLYLCGVPVPEDYDGRVLTEAMNPKFVDQRPVQYQSGSRLANNASGGADLLDDEAEELSAHLRALGYLE